MSRVQGKKRILALSFSFISILQSSLPANGDSPAKCSDLTQWQDYLNELAAGSSSIESGLSAADACSRQWTSSTRGCFDNLRRHQMAQREFRSAGARQAERFRNRWDDLTNLDDIFDVCENEKTPNGDRRVCRPPRNWYQTYADCIRNPESSQNQNNPRCKKVAGWCAVEMRRHHEGIMDADAPTFIFYNPTRRMFIINVKPANASREFIADTLTIIPPTQEGQPSRGVFASFEPGTGMLSPQNTENQGCWNCHADGAPRKISPLWGSVFSQDQKGVKCINDAISAMGPFSASHLWRKSLQDPPRGDGHPQQSCTECHSSDLKRPDNGYDQRGSLVRSDVMTRELFAKLTSWDPSMAPGSFNSIPRFQRAMRILNRINEVDDDLVTLAFGKYVETYRALTEPLRGQSLEHPDRDIGRAELLLKARRDAQIAALYTLKVAPQEIMIVRRVLEEVDRRGLKDFKVMTDKDKEALQEYLGGGRKDCILNNGTRETSGGERSVE